MFRERGKEGERKERNNGDQTHNQGFALTRNRTNNLSLCGTTSNQLSHTGYSYLKKFFLIGITRDISLLLIFSKLLVL